MTNSESEAASSVSALIEKWRAEADRWLNRWRELLPGETRGQFAGSAAQAHYCADELEALLAASLAGLPRSLRGATGGA